MPSTQQFRKRIRSIKNTSQITRAMEMVASVKMQKAVKSILAARSYVQNSWNLLLELATISKSQHPLLQTRDIKRVAVVAIASDRGLCGSYNTDVARKVVAYLKSNNQSNEIEFIAVGRKMADLIKKIAPEKLAAEFPNFEAGAQYEEISPIAKMVIDGYENKKYDQVVVIYAHFASSLKQIPVVKQVLPINQDHIDLPELWEQSQKRENKIEYKFEPDPDTVLAKILPLFTRMQIFGAFLEANASEQSARMVAMKNATDNAKDLISELTLVYNTIRQGSITREIAEISGAAESMK